MPVPMLIAGVTSTEVDGDRRQRNVREVVVGRQDGDDVGRDAVDRRPRPGPGITAGMVRSAAVLVYAVPGRARAADQRPPDGIVDDVALRQSEPVWSRSRTIRSIASRSPLFMVVTCTTMSLARMASLRPAIVTAHDHRGDGHGDQQLDQREAAVAAPGAVSIGAHDHE